MECLDIMAKSVIQDSLLTVHNDWRAMGLTMSWNGEATQQLDANFGAVNAVQEMIFYPSEGAISLLPALPDRLSRGEARGLVFPEGTVDVIWREDGAVEVTVRASREVDAKVLLGGIEQGRLALAAGETAVMRYRR